MNPEEQITALRKLLVEARDTVRASTIEDGISDDRRQYRYGLAYRIGRLLSDTHKRSSNENHQKRLDRIASVGQNAVEWMTALLYHHDPEHLTCIPDIPMDEYQFEALSVIEMLFGTCVKSGQSDEEYERQITQILFDVFAKAFSTGEKANGEPFKHNYNRPLETFSELAKEITPIIKYIKNDCFITEEEFRNLILWRPSKHLSKSGRSTRKDAE